jgi:hypothetical protein
LAQIFLKSKAKTLESFIKYEEKKTKNQVGFSIYPKDQNWQFSKTWETHQHWLKLVQIKQSLTSNISS